MIYLDNAATSWPKPEAVYQAVNDCMREKGGNPNRSGHRMAMLADRIVFETRELVAKLFNAPEPSQVIFTLNATEALNLGIKGLLQTADHVITSSFEHNAVIRPLAAIRKKGVWVTKILTESDEGVLPQEVENSIQKNTKMIILQHASNVTGTLNPIEKIGEIAHKNGILFMVDAAQTAGIFPIDVQKMHIDILSFTGHKSLLGIQGVGGLYLRDGILPVPLKEGGTGANSESLFQPSQLPERYESGTLNTPGIAGLGAGIGFLLQTGIENIRKKERDLTEKLLEGLQKIPGVIVYGPKSDVERAPVISFNIKGMEPADVSFMLDRVFDIASRPGLHCAPDAHRTLGTFNYGTVRLSLSVFNTIKEINACLEAIEDIAGQKLSE
ncbi:aminotransferase class V-fold PLP-dependent enzyme [Dehalobacter sp. DCM]|uniref:aminotransferase class V-fold PLP-dependent enzyme n=1 Tax=Dehalobacter sp. DCM TaxID=2907827 RepID=UPI003081B058|nr:aminotransferase class V-fold PLP-dependent enzyme [Dehalobacter sp. DCM]